MRILLANLKHLYLNRSVWVFCLPLAMLLVSTVSRTQHWYDVIMLCVAGNMLVGAWTAILLMEAIAKPFVLCLPGHQVVPHRVVYTVAAIVNLLLLALIFALRGRIEYGPPLVLPVDSRWPSGCIFWWPLPSWVWHWGTGEPAASRRS